MRVENWCMVTLDNEDINSARVNSGLEVLLPENTTKVIIKYVASQKSLLSEISQDALEAAGLRKAA